MSQLMDLKDQDRLELSLSVRENIVKAMTAKGMPSSPEDRDFLLKALDGMDRTVLSKTKLKIEDKSAQNQENTAKMISDVIKRVQSIGTSVRTITPMLDDDIIVDNKIIGEDDIGVSTMTYDKFIESN